MFRRFLLAALVLLLIGCGEDKTDVVAPEPPPNQPPVIDRVILPNQIEANTPLKLQVIAHDADKDYLAIAWEVSEGTVAGDVWTPPDRAAQVAISVHVTDGTNPTVIQSRNVTVTKQQTVDPPTLTEPPPPPQPEPSPPEPELEPTPPQPEPESPPHEPEGPKTWNIIPRVGIEYIAPGQEILTIFIGDTREQVITLAERTEWVDHETQILFHPRLGEIRCFYKEGKVAAITVNHPRYKPQEDVRVGMDIDAAITKYGEPDKINQGEKFAAYLYYAHGYLFTVTRNNRIASTTIATEVESLPPVFEAWNIILFVGIEHLAPGKEPLRVNLGDTFEQVNALAESAEWVNNRNQKLFNPRLGHFQCLYEDGKITNIIVLDDQFKTAERIGVGSSRNAVVREYGEPDEIRETENFTFHVYRKLGCGFGFFPNKIFVGFISFNK